MTKQKAKHKSPVYRYPDFIKSKKLKTHENKRYWLKLVIDEQKEESIVVILKNPSKAKNEISDKTVNTVCKYIYLNQENYFDLKNIANIIILNLIPDYLTNSKQLKDLPEGIIDAHNLKTIDGFCRRYDKVIIAWGNHPRGLSKEYKNLKSVVQRILEKHKNEIYYVDRMSVKGNPKHGQVWGYKNKLIKINNNE
jgi:hypothetical protein